MRLTGAVLPILTPLDGRDGLDEGSLARLAEHALASGVSGFWVGGTSAEFYALDATERRRLVQCVASVTAGRVPVVAQVGDTATRLVLRHARAALEAGADAVAILNPYFLAWTPDELTEHVEIVAQALGAPVLLYDHPATDPNRLPVDAIVALAESGRVMGLKEGSPDLDRFARIVEDLRARKLDVPCLHGQGSAGLQALRRGGSGLISIVCNVAPAAAVRLVEAFRAGRLDEAASLQQGLSALAADMLAAFPDRTNAAPTIAGYKHIAQRLGLVATARAHRPLRPLSPAERAHLDAHAVPRARELQEGSGQRLPV